VNDKAVGGEASKPDPVRKLTLIVLGVCVVLFVWYVLADRFTPWTDQARVQGFIVPITPKVSGRVISVDVELNEPVKADQVLAQIDPNDYELALRRAESDLELAGQDVGAGGAAVKSAAASLADARSRRNRAQQDFDRVRNTYKADPGAVSKAELDRRQTALVGAKSQVAEAEAELEKAKHELGKGGQDNPKIRAAVAALEKAKSDLAETTLRAPSDGGITNLKIDEGHYANAGAPLMTFVSATDVWIQANMRENSIGNLKVGDRAEITLDIAPGRIFPGKVSSIGFGVKPPSGGEVGELETVKGDSGWLRDAQRFPVIIEFTDDSTYGLRRAGGQADVQIYTPGHPILHGLGWLWIRLMSWLSYVY
jgi:multidrug resistance efflux pump